MGAEERDRLLAVPDLARNRLITLDDLPHALLHSLEVVGREGLITGEVVVAAILDGRTDGDLGFGIELLHRLSENVRSIVE